MLSNVQIVMVRPRFPENIGMAARACANMGVENITLVNPELWPELRPNLWPDLWPDLWEENQHEEAEKYVNKAKNLATSAGVGIIEQIQTASSLAQAVAENTICIGTTARTGGWRQGILTPEAAAQIAWQHLLQNGRVAFVFGSEDKGLENQDIELCTHLVSIPTALSAASLNLAQAILILLYELRKAMPEDIKQQEAEIGQQSGRLPRQGRVLHSPLITLEQQELLISNIKQSMQALGSLPKDNSNYFLLPIRRFVSRSQVRHNEFSMLMGICNKIMRLSKLSSQTTTSSLANNSSYPSFDPSSQAKQLKQD